MRDTSRESADRLHFLSLPQLHLEFLFLLIGFFSLRDVAEDPENLGFALVQHRHSG